MKLFRIERLVWLIVVALIIVATVYITNYIRDHEVYKEAAARCSADKSVLHREIERLDAEKAKVEKEKKDLEQLPVQ